jgi:hypothetical protein
MKTKKISLVSTRVRFKREDLKLVEEAARKRFLSFNAFVSRLAVLGAMRVLEAPDDDTALRIIDSLFKSSADGK